MDPDTHQTKGMDIVSNVGITLAQVRAGTKVFVNDGSTYSAEIAEIQSRLTNKLNISTNGVDGKYGNGTFAAVKQFQGLVGLGNDGVFGKSTLLALEMCCEKIPDTAGTNKELTTVRAGCGYLSSGQTGTAVNHVRTLLRSKGYSSVGTSGAYDTTMATAIRDVQTKNGLGVDGICGQGTLAVLEDTTTDTSWMSGTTVNLTAGKLARLGFIDLALRPENVADLNRVLMKYKVDSKTKVRHFLAQAKHETLNGMRYLEKIYFEYLCNRTENSSYKPFYGAGFMHYTWDEQYLKLKNALGDALIYTPSKYAPMVVAAKYPYESAGYFWENLKSLNSKIVGWASLSADETVRQVTLVVNGGTNGLAERQANYRKALEVLK